MRHFTLLHLEPRPSRLLLLSGGVAHGLAATATFLAGVPFMVKAVLLAGMLGSLLWLAYEYGWRTSAGFIARADYLDGRWRLETGAGLVYRARLTGGYAQPYLLILNFRLDNGHARTLLLLPDALAAEELRRVRVWLRTRRSADRI